MIEVNVGSELSYELPEIEDPEGDDYTLTVNLGVAAIFAKYHNLKITANSTQPKHVGTYPINIVLKDKYGAKKDY